MLHWLTNYTHLLLSRCPISSAPAVIPVNRRGFLLRCLLPLPAELPVFVYDACCIIDCWAWANRWLELSSTNVKPAKAWLSYLSRSASRTSILTIGSMEVNSLPIWLPSKEPATAGIHGGLTRPSRRVFQSTVRKTGASSAHSRHGRQIRVEPSGLGSAAGTGYRPLPRGNSVNKHHVIKKGTWFYRALKRGAEAAHLPHWWRRRRKFTECGRNGAWFWYQHHLTHTP